MLNVAYHYMDLVPKGRDEGDEGAGGVGSPSRRVSGLMDGSRLLTTIGLIRQARPGGFCPACRSPDEGPRRRAGAGQTHGGRLGRPRGRRRGLGGHGPALARHGRNGRNGHGPGPDRVLRRDLGRDDGGDDAALRDSRGPRVRANGRTAKGMAGCHWSACPHVPRRVADVRRGVLRDLHRGENALAQPGRGGWTGSGAGRRLLPQPDQAGEPGPLPRAVRAAWAASLQPDAERRCRRACATASAALDAARR